MVQQIKRWLSTLFIVLLLITITSIVGLWWLNSPPNPKAETPYFTIQEGASANYILMQLHDQGHIRTRLWPKIYLKLQPKVRAMQAGSYEIPAGLTTIEVLRYLQAGKVILHTLTIPEGLSLRQVSLLIEKSGISNAEAFLVAAHDPALLAKYNIISPNAEGWLFPNTYHLPKNYPADQLVQTMLNQFFSQLAVIDPNFKELSPEELHKKVILASLVQKEHRVADEAPLIASVMYNRLRIGMPLGIDSAIIYILTERQGQPHTTRVLWADLEIEDPYNVYKKAGLPPGAIGGSGAIALNAVFHPADTDYLYFVVIPNSGGRHQFTSTLTDHNYHANIYRASLNR
jgi:UPF0755 protein